MRRRDLMCVELVLAAFVLFCNATFGRASTNADDVTALNVLFQSLNSASQLKGWTSNGGDPCGQSWLGVTCSASRVTSIQLSGMGLNGNLGYNMALLTSLDKLDFSNNNLGNGNLIPYNLPPNLVTLNLAGNQFSGAVPYSISNMVNLKYLNLGHNQLSSVNDMFENLSGLIFLDLSFNQFTGELPRSFAALYSLKTLYLQNNKFSGSINVLADLPLVDLDVSNNNFTGWIPLKLKSINKLQTSGNSWNTGPAPPPPPYTAPPPPYRRSPSQTSDNSNHSSNGSGIGAGAIAGIVISLLVVSGIFAFFLIKRKSRTREVDIEKESFAPIASFKDRSSPPVSSPEEEEFAPIDPIAPISLKPPPNIEKSYNDNEFSSKSFLKKASSRSSIKATVYTVADLQVATESFNVENIVREGPFGRMYKAIFDDHKVLAVKKINMSAFPNHSTNDFLDLVSNISKLHHANLTELVGYCAEHGQHLLVYEFYVSGSLQELLHEYHEQTNTLSWNNRVKIALGSARALEYLHEVCSPSVVHRYFTSSNILLDMELNPHLSDSGLGNLIPNEEFQASEQNAGYSPPEISLSGQYSVKSDVYNFGVVMLELMTGRKPFDSSRPRQEQSLVRWASPQLHDIDALDRMVDPALQGLYPSKSLSRFADVIALCVQSEPEFRPPMSEVVQQLMRLVQRANMTNRLMGND